jgi:hypothetical protein
MPTAGTHITVLQRVALQLQNESDPALRDALGDPNADEGSSAATKARFANLGAIGPDLLYALGDFRTTALPLQSMENFLVRICAMFGEFQEQLERIDRYTSGVANELSLGTWKGIERVPKTLAKIVENTAASAVIDQGGVNLWSFFETPREQDACRNKWFWADYLHYVSSGDFLSRLLRNAWNTGNDNIKAYALGYLTHYITDIVGHPFVNQIVGGTYRTQWQRHHLVENFIDTYVWQRWHQQQPDPIPPTTEERGPDTVLGDGQVPDPNRLAEMNCARLHDLIDIGETADKDWVDTIVDEVAQVLRKAGDLLNVDNSRVLDEVNATRREDFDVLMKLLVRTMQETYDADETHPQNLTKEAGPYIEGASVTPRL